MDFFQYKSCAKRNTLLLYVLFAIALCAIVVAVYAAVSVSLYFSPMLSRNFQIPNQFWQWQRFVYVSLAASLLILAGSWYKIYQLKKGGGIAIAQMLGGKRLNRTKDPQERQLRNVIEEMAIASGVPTPAIFILEQQGINAFAAGYAYKDTAIAVTHGAMEMLSRDELQGVVAHEFSHLLHGDTLLKMKMMGLLHGITMISDLGIVMIAGRNSMRYSKYKGGSHPVLMTSGVLFFSIGLIGMLAADMIKAAMSRQREYLADASAVQFTRNPDGIGGALKVMGGYKAGSRLRLPDVQQVSHLFFGDALQSWWQSNWWATHPPLVARIKRIYPRFRGRIEKINEANVRASNREQAAMMFSPAPSPKQLQMNVQQVMDSIGEPSALHLTQAQTILAQIPETIREQLNEEVTAKVLVYLLLLDENKEINREQLKMVSQKDSSKALAETVRLRSLMPRIHDELRLPILDLILPHLQTMNQDAQASFLTTLKALIKANAKVSLFEYLVYQSFLRSFGLKGGQDKEGMNSLGLMQQECEMLVDMVCQINANKKPKRIRQKALAELFPLYQMSEVSKPRLNEVSQALEKLNTCSFGEKKRLLHALVFCVLSDGIVNTEEMETVRLVSMMLGCPMPILQVSR
ncbi:MAG: M48 family metallopeptidase [Ghiorsea sp.]